MPPKHEKTVLKEVQPKTKNTNAVDEEQLHDLTKGAAGAAAAAAASAVADRPKEQPESKDDAADAAAVSAASESAGKVFEDYDCMLNQTNISHNNNKYYVIQIIVQENELSWIVRTRAGRVGETGRIFSDRCGSSDQAVKVFVKKFKDKTRNDWKNRKDFVPVEEKYTLIEVDQSEDTKTADKSTTYAKNMPLGKLSKPQLIKGFDALDDIEAAINREASDSELAEPSSKFYTLIPHSFGRGRPPTINQAEVVKTRRAMITWFLNDQEIKKEQEEA